jgi:hypothetical protein
MGRPFFIIDFTNYRRGGVEPPLSPPRAADIIYFPNPIHQVADWWIFAKKL